MNKLIQTSSIMAIYADGSAGKPGEPGGWGIVAYLEDGTREERGGHIERADHLSAELIAALETYKFIQQWSNYPKKLICYTDCMLIVNGIRCLQRWKANGWLNILNKPIRHKYIWEQIDSIRSDVKIKWRHVKAHSGVEGNEKADYIACQYRIAFQQHYAATTR